MVKGVQTKYKMHKVRFGNISGLLLHIKSCINSIIPRCGITKTIAPLLSFVSFTFRNKHLQSFNFSKCVRFYVASVIIHSSLYFIDVDKEVCKSVLIG